MLDFLPAFDSPAAERMERTAQENATRAAVYQRAAGVISDEREIPIRLGAVIDQEAPHG